MGEQEYLALLDGFTADEIDRINLIAAGTAEDVTIEDAKLYAAWESANARIEEYYSDRHKAMQAETQAKIDASTTIAEQMKENMKAQQQAALRRLQQVENALV